MPAILRDQVWQFVGAFFGLVAIIVSIVLYRTQRRRKALSYEIISRTSLLSIEDEIKGKLEIFFNGKPVQDVHLIVFKIINSGNVPIVSTDYERPLKLNFGEAQVLTAEVAETNPNNLQVSVKIEETPFVSKGRLVTELQPVTVWGTTKVVLEPVLLNSEDSITFKFLVSRLDEISVDGRIVGVKDIKATARQAQNLFQSLGGVVAKLGIGALLVGVSIIVLSAVLDSSDGVAFGFVLALVGPFVMTVLLGVLNILEALLKSIIPSLRDM